LVTALPVFADWASNIVVHDGGTYTVTDVTVTADRIGSRIGKVTKYSDVEGTYRGNFSNAFPKNTPYYSIHDTSENDAIAVHAPDGRYILAVYDGEYPEAAMWTSVYFWIGVAAVVIAIMVAAVWLTNPRKKGDR
jgi:hypothetical protein